MNDTAQETTALIATLVEHEVLGASLLPAEKKKKHRSYPFMHASAAFLFIHYNRICKHIDAKTP